MYLSYSTWVFALLVAAALGLLRVYLLYVYGYWKRKRVPYCKPEPLFGSSRGVLFAKESMYAMLHRVYEELDGQPFGGFYMMTTPCLLIRDPEQIHNILVKDFAHFSKRLSNPQLKVDRLAQHLFAIDGNLWRDTRLHMTAVFSESHTQRVFFMIQECCTRLQGMVDNALRGQPSRVMRLADLISSYCTDVTGMCAFGLECGAIGDPNSQFRQIGNLIFDSNRFAVFRGSLAYMLPRVATFLGMSYFASDVREFFSRIMMEIFQYRKKKGVLRDDFIHLLMELQQNSSVVDRDGNLIDLTDDFLVAQVFMAFAVSYQLTSSTMSFCLHELTMNPQIQTRARKEVDAVLSRYGGQLTYQSVGEMSYMDMILAETMRLYPALGHIFRECTKPYTIPRTDIQLEEGTVVFISLTAMHRDPRFFQDPLRFNPERFKAGHNNVLNDMCKAYLPFGCGPRNCLGQNLALVEMKAGLAALLSRFEFRPCIDSTSRPTPLEPRKLLVAPANWLQVRIAPRPWVPVS